VVAVIIWKLTKTSNPELEKMVAGSERE